ncbi:MAG TPA: SgcJ/EcaC family oxidoreductase [Pirellulales bacterium]|nr:SgcJ/EcaC family oxidoreductase [Pirellulales bacterium]
MIRNLLCLAIFAWASWVPPSWAVAADDAKPSPDEAAIRKAIESYTDAFNKGDAAAVANHFSETGAYIDPITGEREVGREAIAKALADRFSLGLKPKLSVTVDSIRLLDDNVAIEEGTATIITKKSGPEVSTYVAIHVKKDGKWQLDSVRETLLPEPEADDSSPLEELSWMIGRWADKSDGASVETVCNWALDGAFITRSFTIAIEGQPLMSGTQIIAWDAANKRIRSWVFDSDGTFGEGAWTKEEDHWRIRATNTLADGSKATAVQIIKKIDDDSFTFESISRQVDGELLPNVDPITIVRQTND